jgi:membrane protease YdiL (CAAX protease family)
MAASPTIVSSRLSPLSTFLLLTFAITWAIWLPLAAASHGLVSFQVSPTLGGLLGAFGPSLAGVATAVLYGGRRGLRLLLGRLLIWRVGAQWYAFVLLWPAALSLVVTALHVVLGGTAPDFANPLVLTLYPVPPEALAAGPWVLLPFVFLQQMLVGSSMGEELGWRGLALPHLQERRSALISSLIVGLVWGVWHLPKFFIAGDPIAEVFFGWFLLGIVADAILFTWVYNNTGGSLLLALLLHTSISITALFLTSVDAPVFWSLGLKWVFVAVVVTLAGPAHLSRRKDRCS